MKSLNIFPYVGCNSYKCFPTCGGVVATKAGGLGMGKCIVRSCVLSLD